MYYPPVSSRVDLLINERWKFHRGDISEAQLPTFDDAQWPEVTLPHTWNAGDGQEAGPYYRGVSWYRLHYTVPARYAGRQLYLQFDGASLVADIYVNGHYLGRHEGGYTAFRFDATAALCIGGDNVIAVKVDNAYETNIAPYDGDFTVFGGLYRAVHLVVTDKIHAQMLDYGSSGLFLRQTEVSAASAHLQITTGVSNDSDDEQDLTLTTVIVAADQVIVQTRSTTQRVAAHTDTSFVQNTTIAQPHLWDGQSDPYLYRVYAQVQVGETVADVVSAPLGFRSYFIDPDQGFFLNGRYLDLRGVNLHQDREDKGWAVSSADIDEDFRLICEMGANAIRTAHYTHAQHLYARADASGVILWSEQPILGRIVNSPAFARNAEQQLSEMIRQYYNHPSVIFWSIANEPHNMPEIRELLKHLHERARALDPDRFTTFADSTGVPQPTDVMAYNRYYGWYLGGVSDLEEFLRSTRQKHPGQRFAIGEYGAGASIYQHEERPARPTTTDHFHPEEWQALFHEEWWQVLKQQSSIWGKFIWTMFDLASADRDEGDHGGRNDKGLCTYDRRICKDAYYWYKASWTTAPFVYITTRRHVNRTQAHTDIKVYANTRSVALRVNGIALESKTSTNRIFVWPDVPLQEGKNTIEASGEQNDNIYTDEVLWQYHPQVRIRAGARMPFTTEAGECFEADHYYHDGATGIIDEQQRYRHGQAFSYRIPLANGTYTLTLEFCEPEKIEVGQRIFSVKANDESVIEDLDIYQQVGQNTKLQRSAQVFIGDGMLTLEFRASVAEAIVFAIELVRQA